ncbi:hypothetical protein [Staphylococcus chromogenes]|uniref:hypothetical protein n=1 Tax=Staphylococcus chromogenes TaxID=46126 RepID=UPI0028FE60AA|nr:hypothetical protein [Staphylococcus chromogenes]MDU0452295.1 hypothetical protein [Staphylococcus chromogenes]
MKKILIVLFASLLVLSACGNDDMKEEKKTEQKEKKSEKKEEKQTSNTTQTPTQEDTTVNDNQQPTTVDYNHPQNYQESNNINENVNVSNGETEQQQEPTKEEIYEWDKQNIQGGTDAGLIDYDEVNRILEENRKIKESEVSEEFTPEEEAAIMEQLEQELEAEGLK